MTSDPGFSCHLKVDLDVKNPAVWMGGMRVISWAVKLDAGFVFVDPGQDVVAELQVPRD